MDLKVLERSKNRVKFEVIGEGHSFCNALRKELWNDKSVEIAGYNIEHSLVGEPVFTVETSRKDPKDVILETVENIRKRNKELKDLFKKL